MRVSPVTPLLLTTLLVIVTAWQTSCRSGATRSEQVTPEPAVSRGALRPSDTGRPCQAQDARAVHDGRIRSCHVPAQFAAWDGQACRLEKNQCDGLSCEGADCGRVFATLDDCQRAYATCIAR